MTRQPEAKPVRKRAEGRSAGYHAAAPEQVAEAVLGYRPGPGVGSRRFVKPSR